MKNKLVSFVSGSLSFYSFYCFTQNLLINLSRWGPCNDRAWWWISQSKFIPILYHVVWNRKIIIYNFFLFLYQKLMDEFGRKFFVFHCMGHRLELVFGKAMKKYKTFLNIEKQANQLYAYYSKSHKRTNYLKDFLEYEEIRPFQMSKIFDVREVFIFLYSGLAFVIVIMFRNLIYWKALIL